MINSWCAELCKTMGAVRTCWWQKSLTEKKERERDDNRTVPKDGITVNGNASIPQVTHAPSKDHYWDYLPPRSSASALEMMITSHLSTSCSTIIIGPDASAINQVTTAIKLSNQSRTLLTFIILRWYDFCSVSLEPKRVTVLVMCCLHCLIHLWRVFTFRFEFQHDSLLFPFFNSLIIFL